MMNLATRCTACGTIFRVVQDQLKVSEGWVRCGRCQAVFNAQQGLFDLEREAPPPWQPVAASPDPAESADPTPAAAEAAVAEDADDAAPLPDADLDTAAISASVFDPLSASALGETQDSEPAVERPAYADETLAAQVRPEDFDEMAEAETIEAPATESPPVEATAADTDVDAAAAPDDETAPEATPEFVRQAQRDERWEQPGMRAALAGLAVLAALGLALQVTGHYRQRIAAQWPESTPWLQRYCAAFGCRLDTLRRIDDVSIESTALTQIDPTPQDDGASNALRLAVTLRNRGLLPIAMPSVDLSLTGADGELVSRRALSPVDFHVSDPQLAPGVDAPLAVNFSVTGRRVSGYTVEVFYP